MLPWRVAAWALGLIPLTLRSSGFCRAGSDRIRWSFSSITPGIGRLRLLLATLAMTPLRKITHLTEPIRIRRTLGLWSYAFLCLHFSIYLVFDLGLSVSQLGADLIERTYITLGFMAWLMLLPLAITSTNAWQRRLKRRWLALHQLIYPAAILGSIHYLWLVKADTREPLTYLAILLGLLAFRLPTSRTASSIAPGS